MVRAAVPRGPGVRRLGRFLAPTRRGGVGRPSPDPPWPGPPPPSWAPAPGWRGGGGGSAEEGRRAPMGGCASLCCGGDTDADGDGAPAEKHEKGDGGAILVAGLEGTLRGDDWFFTPPGTPTRGNSIDLGTNGDDLSADGDDTQALADLRRRIPYPTPLKEGYVNLSTAQRRAVRALRQRVEVDYPEVHDEDMRPIFDLIMTRMLRSRKFDPAKAEPLFRVHLAWRREYQPRERMHEQEALRGEAPNQQGDAAAKGGGDEPVAAAAPAPAPDAASRASGPTKLDYVSVSGRDVDGHPVLVMRVALKFNQWKEEVKKQPTLSDADAKEQSNGLLAHHSSIEERMLIELADTDIESMVSVVDLTGVHTMDFFSLGRRIAKVMRPYTTAIQEQYRGTMFKTYVYPTGALFSFMITLARPFVKAHVLQKVQGVKKGELKSKLQAIVPDFVPVFDE